MHGRRRSREAGVSGAGLALALLLVALGLLVAAEGYAATVPLLRPGEAWVPGDGFDGADPCPGERCDDVRWQPGASFSFGQEVRNDAPAEVTILGYPGVANRFVRIDTLVRGLDRDASPATTTEPFDTLTLDPGETAFLVWQGAFTDCEDLEDADLADPAVLRSVPVRMRMLLVEHVRDLELGRPLRFSGDDRECR